MSRVGAHQLLALLQYQNIRTRYLNIQLSKHYSAKPFVLLQLSMLCLKKCWIRTSGIFGLPLWIYWRNKLRNMHHKVLIFTTLQTFPHKTFLHLTWYRPGILIKTGILCTLQNKLHTSYLHRQLWHWLPWQLIWQIQKKYCDELALDLDEIEMTKEMCCMSNVLF